MLTAFLFFIMIACIAFLWNEGLWGNAITLINVVLAALIATNYFEPLASFIEGKSAWVRKWPPMLDFFCIWLIFCVAFAIMRGMTDKLTTTKVKFKGVVELAGRTTLAVVVSYVFMSFTCMTLHLAPLAENSFGGSFHRASIGDPHKINEGEDDEFETDKYLPTNFLFLAPDRQWLTFVAYLSWRRADDEIFNGPLARWWGQRTFDPESRFLFKNGARRRMYERHNKVHGFTLIPDE